MRRVKRGSARAALLALLLPCLAFAGQAPAPPGAAQPSTPEAAKQQLEQTERARAAQLDAQKAAVARAADAAAQAKQLQQVRAEAAARLQAAEQATADAAARMQALAGQERAAQARLDATVKEMKPLLPLIERLSLYPAATLLAVPVPPEQAVRGLLVLQSVTHAIEAKAVRLTAQRRQLEAARHALAEEAPRLAAAEEAQARAAADLDRQIALANQNRSQAENEAAAAAARAAALGARANDLRSLLKDLEAARRAEAARARAAAARARRQKQAAKEAAARQREAALASPTGSGTLPRNARPHRQLLVPVVGKVVRAWGEKTPAGPAIGISYDAPPQARVVAPCSGRVAFAAPFRSYGKLLILDCGGGYDMVLAGFDRLDVAVGDRVRQGQPVGALPGWDPRADGPRPSLYVELRRNGAPTNPAPWLGAGHRK